MQSAILRADVEVRRAKLDCITSTVAVTQLTLNPRWKSGTLGSLGWSQLECCLLLAVCQSAYCQKPTVYTICHTGTCDDTSSWPY